MSLHISFAGQPLKQAPTLVFLHGWGMHSGIWKQLSEQLKDDFSIVLIDLPGHGYSNVPVEACSLDAMVEQIHEVLKKSNISNAAWLGWSLGGVVAMEYARRYNEEVSSLITLCSSPCFVATDDWSAGMPADTFNQFSKAFKVSSLKTLQRFAMLQVQGSATARHDLKELKRLITEVTEPDQEALSAALEILEADHRLLTEALDQSGLSVAHVLCELDTLAPVGIADYLRQLSHSTVDILLNLSHVPMLSAPEQLAELIRGKLL
ncbi:alpha/beta fold hydrolase [Aliamphritea ceti]|uniref:alpha/beta fold hydrolase n=1 Tax=Aliamphritea ceti TaxID=1524258 RepID=UPI0021C3F4F9|nr:alpha/beta fold hydrolase [Aliamphritea ceti]